MSALEAGDLLPRIQVPPPGPRSRELASLLRRYEPANLTYVSSDFPVFWAEALGANVLDADGNIFLDLTAGFGVAATGHRNPRVCAAVSAQLNTLMHGLADVHPPHVKVQLLARLAEIAPRGLEQAILASSGAEAVEIALKTSRLATGKSGVLCFRGAYHGLTYGALAVTDGDLFRGPFQDQLGLPVVRVPFPNPYRPASELRDGDDPGRAALNQLSTALDEHGRDIGAVIVEPIQGRGGVVIPPEGFLRGLREECDRRGLLLVIDEILTGFGRTGRWFACEHEGVLPDLMCVGKALSGGLPLSACLGRAEVMSAWPPSQGAAIHTSTFLGHPLACAAALAQIEELRSRELVTRSAELGRTLLTRLRSLDTPVVGDVRGRGLLAAIELVADATTRRPDSEAAKQLMVNALRRGLLITAEHNVVSITPPLTITDAQLDFAIRILRDCLPGG